MSDFIPEDILKLADKYRAKVKILEAPSRSKEKGYEYLISAEIELILHGKEVSVSLLHNTKTMDGFEVVCVCYDGWFFSEDDYYYGQLLDIIIGIFDDRMIMKRRLFREVLYITDKDGKVEFGPRL